MTDKTTQADGYLSRLTAELEALGWRHMDSAPKDGSVVIISNGECVDLGYWNDQRYNTRPNPYWHYMTELCQSVTFMRDNRPKYWMPKPKISI